MNNPSNPSLSNTWPDLGPDLAWLTAVLQQTDAQLSDATLLTHLQAWTMPHLTPDRLTALWQVLAQHLPAIPGMEAGQGFRLDLCGTGGSGLVHFNTSSTVALVLASMGVPVTKFGNRSATSRTGSTDFLAALGLHQTIPPMAMGQVLADCGVLFLAAPHFLPGLKRLAPLRRQLGQKTAFNVVGPLLNPCWPTHQLLGNSQPSCTPWMQTQLRQRPAQGWIVTGHAQQDDLTPWGASDITPVQGPPMPPYQGKHPVPTTHLNDEVTANVATFWAIVTGADATSPAYELVCLNAAAGLCVVGQASTLNEGQHRVAQWLATGQVAHAVKRIQAHYATFTP
jgi:anthranilate phosphoribosyltransferase